MKCNSFRTFGKKSNKDNCGVHKYNTDVMRNASGTDPSCVLLRFLCTKFSLLSATQLILPFIQNPPY